MINSFQIQIVVIRVSLVMLFWFIDASSVGAKAGERFAVIIANKDYRHTTPVEFADRDAMAVEQLMISVLGLPKRHIFRYDNASMADFRFLFGDRDEPGQIGNMLRGRDSQLYVYFAGHGSKEANRQTEKALPYLLGTDSRPDDLRATAYSLNLLIEQLDNLQKETLPQGRVKLILESCFSGRSDAGELISGVSAPALALPVDFGMRKGVTNDKLVVMSAAQSNQFAIWDKAHKQSVFTDALVSGMFGEADEKRFGGNGDGNVALGEIERFVTRRIARRVLVVRPGADQQPDFFGGKAEEVLVKTNGTINPWTETIQRRHKERLSSGLMLARSDASQIQKYLKSCIYCPRKDELRKFLYEHSRKQAICEIENPTIDRLLTSGTVQEIQSFKKDCECCGRPKELDARLTLLQAQTAKQSHAKQGGSVLDSVTYNKRGIAHGKKGQYDSAIAAFDKAIQLNPGYARAYANRGIARGQRGEYDNAIADLDKAIQLNPRDARAYYYRGRAYRDKGQPDHAATDFDNAIKLDPKYAKADYHGGLAYNRKNQQRKLNQARPVDETLIGPAGPRQNVASTQRTSTSEKPREEKTVLTKKVVKAAPASNKPPLKGQRSRHGQEIVTALSDQRADVEKETFERKALLDRRQLVFALQSELKRVGCLTGKVDGKWGPQSRRALTKFNKYSVSKLTSSDPTTAAIDAVKEHKSRLCPKTATARSRPQSKSSKPKKSAPKKARVVAKKKEAKTPRRKKAVKEEKKPAKKVCVLLFCY